MDTRQEVEVAQYKSARDYQRDAQLRLDAGWRILGQTETDGHVNLGRTATRAVVLSWALGPLGLIAAGSRTKGRVSVTWARDVPVVPEVIRPKPGTRKPRPQEVDGPSRPREALLWLAVSVGILILAMVTLQAGWLALAIFSAVWTLPRALRALNGTRHA
jgi:hypothetical protein